MKFSLKLWSNQLKLTCWKFLCVYVYMHCWRKDACADAKHKINLMWPKLTSVIIFGRKKPLISLSESWFYNTVDFVWVKSTKTLMKREITIISFVFAFWMHYLLNFGFLFFFKFVFRIFALSLIHTDIIH